MANNLIKVESRRVAWKLSGDPAQLVKIKRALQQSPYPVEERSDGTIVVYSDVGNQAELQDHLRSLCTTLGLGFQPP